MFALLLDLPFALTASNAGARSASDDGKRASLISGGTLEASGD